MTTLVMTALVDDEKWKKTIRTECVPRLNETVSVGDYQYTAGSIVHFPVEGVVSIVLVPTVDVFGRPLDDCRAKLQAAGFAKS